MSAPTTETPGQKAARERRERRQAKMDGGTRLDKITQLSGRAPETARQASPSPARAAASSPTSQPASSAASFLPPPGSTNHPDAQAQQEASLRNMMRQQHPSESEGAPEDPMARLLSQLAGGIPGLSLPSDPNDPNAPSGGLPISGADLAAATGLPPFLANILTGQASTTKATPESPLWKVTHIIFSILVGIYLIMAINTSISTYGKEKPPRPAVAQSPFVLFLTGEALLQGTKAALGQGVGGRLGTAYKLLKEFARDGSIVLFILGVVGWWNGGMV